MLVMIFFIAKSIPSLTQLTTANAQQKGAEFPCYQYFLGAFK